VYSIGKFFGYRFRPWGAVKAAAKIAKIGAVLAVVGVGLDVLDWVRSSQTAKRREQARREAVKFIRESRAEVRKSLLGDDADSRGPSAYLEGHIAELRGLRDKTQRSLISQEQEVHSLRERLLLLSQLVADARVRLGLPPESDVAWT
jgi:hypothetical protein